MKPAVTSLVCFSHQCVNAENMHLRKPSPPAAAFAELQLQDVPRALEIQPPVSSRVCCRTIQATFWIDRSSLRQGTCWPQPRAPQGDCLPRSLLPRPDGGPGKGA